MCLVGSLEHVLAMAMFVRALHDDLLCASLVFVLRLPQSFVTHIVKHLRYICRVAASKHTVAFLTDLIRASVAPAVSVIPPLMSASEAWRSVGTQLGHRPSRDTR